MRQLLLLAVVMAVVWAEIIAFNKDAVDKIFKGKENALFLFTTTGRESKDALTTFTKLAETRPEGLLLTHSDSEDGHGLYKRLVEFFGFDVSTVPTVVFRGFEGDKYVLEGKYTVDNLKEFIRKAEAKEAEPFLKSHPIPESDSGPVKTLVGKTFKEVVLNSDKEVLVKFYAPWCGACKNIAPEFEKAAAQLANNPNVILAQVDSTGNEVAGVTISSYPTLIWWRKDKSLGPVDFKGRRDTEGLINWVKENTEYPWVESEAGVSAETAGS